MNWMTVAWPMVAASCATLGLIELRIALSEPPRAARLIFASSAFTSAAIAGLELAMMRTSNAPDWLFYAKATDVVVLLLIALLAAFILVYFGTGNRWLALATPALFAVGVVYDFVPGSDMTYLRIDGFREVETFGGASFFVANGVVNPADAFAYLGTTLLVIFVLDASIRLWRRGGRRRALVVGGSLAFFIVAGSVESAMVDAGIISLPYLISWSYLAFLFAMISELNADVLSATRLARDLREREQEMALAGEAAQLGMWRWDLQRDKIWATSRARALLGFSEGELIDAAKLLSALQSEDREALSRTVTGQDAPNREFEVEYRMTHAEGGERWVASRGQIERNATGQPVYMRGVLADVSRRHDSEVELDQLRAQLRHASRVSMMGQLASALAHELSQPLGAILRNTEAAELFLLHDPPNLEELRAILTDIKEDDLRASGVIDRLRALLKHRTITPRAISLSDLLQAIRELTRIDAASDDRDRWRLRHSGGHGRSGPPSAGAAESRPERD